MKVMTILGTRPEIIRLSRVMALLDRSVDHVLVHTGQNYDYELNEIFFEELEIRKPDHFLGVDTSSLGRVYGNILIGAEEALRAEKPDAVLILGDTNSSIAAIIAKRMRIPIYHMEAGNRCFDPNVPEEVNRRIVDHTADFNLVYTEHARRNLLREGLHPRRIYLTGSPLREVLEHFAPRIEDSDILDRLGLEAGRYLVVSMHREENVDDESHLRELLGGIEDLTEEHGCPAIVSTHPRTRSRLEALGLGENTERVSFLKPFGFFDYSRLQREALCALSDSGTISEEAAIAGFPAVTIRNAMERPEAMDTGTILLTGIDRRTIVEAVRVVADQFASDGAPEGPRDYGIRNTSTRVLNVIVGTARLHRRWDNLQDIEAFWES